MPKPPSTSALLKRLRPFIDAAASCAFEPGKRYECCVRASLAKAYELAFEAHTKRKSRISFFLVPSLRSVCEDVIVLGYMAKIDEPQRDELTWLLTTHELRDRFAVQAVFFDAVRPDQPVLRLKDASLEEIEARIRDIWKSNGWPGLKKGYMPKVRQIAEKHHLDLLTTVYDYLYRLTSGMVHFNPQVLLRSGWGNDPVNVTFSPRNFDAYYLAFAQTYGLLLLCLYFELFGDILGMNEKEASVVQQIRDRLLEHPRWPEMVTYEEMNKEPPTGQEVIRMLVRLHSAERYKSGFLVSRDAAAEQCVPADVPAAASRRQARG